MEELQSTEILDREILEDARKKAYRILKTADETVKANASAWERKTRDSLDELHRKYAGLRKLAAGEIMARLPLDKRRSRAEKIESLLHGAVETWYAGLDRERVLSTLAAELAARLAECDDFAAGDAEPRVLIHKLDEAEAEGILNATLPGRTWRIERASFADSYPGIVLENSAVRITASLTQTVDFLLHEKRAELAASLLGTTAIAGEEAL